MTSSSPEIHRREGRLPTTPGAVASLLEPVLAEAAGADAIPVSLTLDYGAPAAGGATLAAEAWVDRATRTLVFAHGRLTDPASGALVATASAVFRRAASQAATP